MSDVDREQADCVPVLQRLVEIHIESEQLQLKPYTDLSQPLLSPHPRLMLRLLWKGGETMSDRVVEIVDEVGH